MTSRELWEAFRAETGLPETEYQAWSFGGDGDLLAQLVYRGEKTATASAGILYALEQEPLPQPGQYSVILNSREEAVCIIRTTAVTAVPFWAVTEAHARKEGEGDKSLSYWQEVHRAWFSRELAEEGLSFCEDMEVVCEEFEVVYR